MTAEDRIQRQAAKKQNTRLSMCEGKDRHSRKRAKEVARAQRKKGHVVAEYKCKFCGTWHVGSTDSQKDVTTPTWRPREGKDRPTPERKKRGDWVFLTTERAGAKAARDMAAHPIDRLEHAGVLSSEQASAGRDYEALYRVCDEVTQIRDSTTIWEPQGHDSTDGPVEAKERYRDFCRAVGAIRENALRQVCVFGREPRGTLEIGALREALNEAARFFAPQGLRGQKRDAKSMGRECA